MSEKIVVDKQKGNDGKITVTGSVGYEKRTKQIGVVVTPSLHAKLKELKEENYFKSANDLINELLEDYVKKIK